MMHLLLRRMDSLLWMMLLVILSFLPIMSQASHRLSSVMMSDSSSQKPETKCVAGGTCQPLESSLCLDVILPYKHTFLHPSFSNQSQVRQFLSRFDGLRKIPKCWTPFESLICTAFLPRCETESSEYFLPTQDMCRNARSQCLLIQPLIHHLCSNESLFATNCSNPYQDLKFSNPSPTKCLAPVLVATDDSSLWLKGIEGCAFNCSDPRFSHEDKRFLASFIFKGSLLSFLVSSLACLTFIVDWKTSNRYPAVLIFYLCFCIAMVSLSFLFQFTFFSREQITCRPDSTVKYSEPGSSDNNASCNISFLFLYYFGVASLIWFVHLCYDCNRYFDLKNKSSEGNHERQQMKHGNIYYHFSAWSIPLVIILSLFLFSKLIDASFVAGVCFVGLNDWTARLILVLIPTFVAILIGEYFLLRCLWTLSSILKVTKVKDPASIPLKSSSSDERSKIRKIILKLSVLAIFAPIASVVIIYSNIFEYLNSSQWTDNLISSVICSLNISDVSLPDVSLKSDQDCNSITKDLLQQEPSLRHVFLQLGCIFTASFVVSSWTWNMASLLSWRRFFLRVLKSSDAETGRKFVKKDALIAEAYDQYKEGHPVVLHVARYEDPVGINLTPATSHDVSTTFVQGLQNRVGRRGAVADATEVPGTSSSKFKAFFKRGHSLYADGSSVSDVSIFRSNATANNTSLAESQAGTSRLSVEETRELREFVGRQKRKKSRESRLARKASSNVSSHSFMLPAARSVSQSILNARQQQQQEKQQLMTDLPPNYYPAQQPVDLLAFYQRYLQMMSSNVSSLMTNVNNNQNNSNLVVAPQSVAQGSCAPFFPDASSGNLSTGSRVRGDVLQRLRNPSGSPVIHGMIAQREELNNPLTEQRKPDCKIPYLQQNIFPLIPTQQTTPDLQSLMSNPFLSGLYPMPPLFPFTLPTPFPTQFMIPPQVNPFLTQMLQSQVLQPQQQSFPSQGQFLSQNLIVSPQTTNNESTTRTTTQSPIDLLLMNRQRAELDPLIRGVDSGSEVGSNVIPMMSDSEGFFTDGDSLMVQGAAAEPSMKDKQSNNSNLKIKQEVEERFQKIEASLNQESLEEEAKKSSGNFDLNRNEQDNTINLMPSVRRPKSLDETSSSQRKKKSTSKKHRMKKKS